MYAPEVDVKRVKVPVALFQGDNDVLSTVKDVDRLARELKEAGVLLTR